MSDSKAFRSGIGYTVGNILIKGINFLTLPIFSRLLSKEEFGVYNVFVSYDSILFVLIGLALHASIRSANLEFRGKVDRYTSSISLIYIGNALLFLGIVALFYRQLSSLLALPPVAVVLLILGLFTFGCACFLMHYGVYVEDLSNVLNVVLRFIFYATGIFYDVSTRIPNYGALLSKVNPIAFLISAMRQGMLYGQTPDLGILAAWLVFSLLLALAGIRKIYKEENSYAKAI